jgi:predicted ATP-grasp superfamily ATP-dependent carboligase
MAAVRNERARRGRLSGVRVLLTEDAPAYGVLAGLRALRAEGAETWVAVTGPGTYCRWSRATAGTVTVPDPGAEPDGYAEALAAAARELELKAVLPGTDAALLALAGREEKFPRGAAVGTCAPEVVQRATDKSLLVDLAAEAGLDTPPTQLVTRGQLDGSLEIGFPAIVKTWRSELRTSSGAAGGGTVRRVDSVADLHRVVDSLPGDRWLVQPYLQGRLAAVSGVAWKGRVVCAAHQVARRIYPPDCGISAFAVTTPPDEALEAAVSRLIALVGWSGLFQAQVLRSDDHASFIDLNPRMYGSLSLTVAAGLNLPAIWVERLRGSRPQLGAYRIGARYRSEERDAGAIVTATLARRWREAAGALVPRPGTTHAVFSLRDPLPLLTSIGHLKKAPALIRRRWLPSSSKVRGQDASTEP